jgi:hypothetical protein
MSGRGWAQFSLKTFLLLTTAFCLWLGLLADSAKRQRDAVRAIRDMGGEVFYEYSRVEYENKQALVLNATPPAPAWIINLLGEDILYDAVAVTPKKQHIPNSWLGAAMIHNDFSDRTDDALDVLLQLTRLQYVELTGTSVTDDGVERLRKALPACEIIR